MGRFEEKKMHTKTGIGLETPKKLISFFFSNME